MRVFLGITGASGAPYARRLLHRNDTLGYTAVGWTVDTLGWQGTSLGRSTTSVVQRALEYLQPGEIILMHVGANPTDASTLDADALPTIISEIEQRGYELVALPGHL